MRIEFAERKKTVKFCDLQIGDTFMSFGDVFVKIEEMYGKDGVDGGSYNAYNLGCACFEDIASDETVTKVEVTLEARV